MLMGLVQDSFLTFFSWAAILGSRESSNTSKPINQLS